MEINVAADTISAAEWEVMRIVWTVGRTNAGEIIKQLQAKKQWSESTIKTLMRRLVQKDLLLTERDGHRFWYSAHYGQNEMMLQVTTNLFGHMCDMHKGQLLLSLLKATPLSTGDIAALQAELTQKDKTAPEMVPCDCLSETGC